jgi:uncharacterized protein (UPF0261 family)
VRTLPDEMIQLGHLFAERLNQATGPIEVMVPTAGLSIPNVPGGLFWDPESDAGFLAALKAELRPDIKLSTHPWHINATEFALAVAERFVSLLPNTVAARAKGN